LLFCSPFLKRGMSSIFLLSALVTSYGDFNRFNLLRYCL
jgi:hypothetical protein